MTINNHITLSYADDYNNNENLFMEIQKTYKQ